MEHLPLLFFLFTIFIGCGFIGLFIYLNLKYKHPLLRFYLVQLGAHTVFVTLLSLSMYGFLNTHIYPNVFKVVKNQVIFALFFLGPVVYYQTRMFLYTADIEWSKRLRTIFLFLGFFYPSLAVLMIVAGFPYVLGALMVFTWFLIFITLLVVLFFRYKKISDPFLKYLAKIMLIAPLLHFPLAVIDAIVQKDQALLSDYPKGIMGTPLIYLINNLLSILVLLKAKELATLQSFLPASFILNYHITDREKEIIEMIVKGLSNKEIASKLFLSPATVRNHITNILEKTGTKSRGKLIHLAQNS